MGRRSSEIVSGPHLFQNSQEDVATDGIKEIPGGGSAARNEAPVAGMVQSPQIYAVARIEAWSELWRWSSYWDYWLAETGKVKIGN